MEKDNKNLDKLKIETIEDETKYKENKRKLSKEPKKRISKSEYIPIIGLIGLLILLIIILVLVALYDKKDYDIKVPEEDFNIVEKVVDTSDSKCSDKEISQLYGTANSVRISYKPVQKVVGTAINLETNEEYKTLGYVQKVEITNLSKDVYLIVSNNNKNTKKQNIKLTSKDAKDGKITYFTEYSSDLVTYSIKVYSSNGDCMDELFREFEFVTPIYNRFSDMDICDNYKEFKYCQKYITEDRPTQQEFMVELNAYQKKHKVTTNNAGKVIDSTLEEHKELLNKNKEKKDDNLLIIIAVIAVVLVTGVVIVIVLRKKKEVK